MSELVADAEAMHMEHKPVDVEQPAVEPSAKGKTEHDLIQAMLERAATEVRYNEALVITTLPRGSLQIAQPAAVREVLLKGYAKEFHAEDRLTWRSMIEMRALRLSQAWSEHNFGEARFVRDFLRPAGIEHGVAVGLSGPVLEGYPGAIHFYRNPEASDYSDAEVAILERLSKELDAALLNLRKHASSPRNLVMTHASSVRQFVFNERMQPQVWGDSLSELDSRLREGILGDAKQRFAHLNGRQVASDRVPIADARGDLWNFRVVAHKTYPALGDGPFVFFCQQPDCKQWGRLQPVDFEADPEVARLIPALQYMREHFSKGPTLVDIAKSVHLSPFHFHRRFTELLGITPKHFLLDCQTQQAKHLLLTREKSLADIAAACGFAHQSHFTSRFKQATGLTPTRWRRLAIEVQQQSGQN